MVKSLVHCYLRSCKATSFIVLVSNPASIADPTYMIRAIPSNASDNVYCTLLAQSAVHGAMAGYTGFTVGPVNSRHAYIPIAVRNFFLCTKFLSFCLMCYFQLIHS